jgi:hypothetical protein
MWLFASILYQPDLEWRIYISISTSNAAISRPKSWLELITAAIIDDSNTTILNLADIQRNKLNQYNIIYTISHRRSSQRQKYLFSPSVV